MALALRTDAAGLGRRGVRESSRRERRTAEEEGCVGACGSATDLAAEAPRSTPTASSSAATCTCRHERSAPTWACETLVLAPGPRRAARRTRRRPLRTRRRRAGGWRHTVRARLRWGRAGRRMGDHVHQMATSLSPPRKWRHFCAIFELACLQCRHFRRGGEMTPRRWWRTQNPPLKKWQQSCRQNSNGNVPERHVVTKN